MCVVAVLLLPAPAVPPDHLEQRSKCPDIQLGVQRAEQKANLPGGGNAPGRGGGTGGAN